MNWFPKKLTFKWIQNCYKDGTLTPTELAKEIVKRSKSYSDYNIWIIEPQMDFMLKYIEKLPDNCESLPLWGIPFAVKDNIDILGMETTAGCPKYAYMAKKNASVVEKLILAGAIPVGKTNLDQFATGLVGTRSPYGEVHNALNEKLISGGSSSGSAVSVALGMAAFSLGTDTAGSGRVPAALNGIVGYKPPLGAWSTKGVVPACESLDCVTVFTNSIEDSEIVNLAARGYDKECCWSKEYDNPIHKLPKKIYVPDNPIDFFGQYADIYLKKWNSSLERIKSLGIDVEYIDCSIFSKAASILYDGPYVAERWEALGKFVEENSKAVFPVTEKILRSGSDSKHTSAELFRAIHKLKKYQSETNEILKDSVLIMPTSAGTFTRSEVRENPIETNSKMGLYTNHCNLLDLCALEVPENTQDKNIPFGISIFALSKNESLILGTGEAFLKSENIQFAVCGLHKNGYPLEYQLTQIGAKYFETVKTAKCYKLYKLNTNPIKPGLVKTMAGGSKIEVDIYKIPIFQIGNFLNEIPSPLTIGTIFLEDGRSVRGFLCEEADVQGTEDISSYGSFKI